MLVVHLTRKTAGSPHLKGLRLVQVTHNDVNIGTGELFQLGRRVRVTDDGKDTVLWVALL